MATDDCPHQNLRHYAPKLRFEQETSSPACTTLTQDRPESNGPVEALARPAQAQAVEKASSTLTDNGETGPAKVPTIPANFFAFSPANSVLAVTYAGPSPLYAGPPNPPYPGGHLREGGTSASLPGSSIEKVKAPGAYWLATVDLTARTIANQVPLDVAPRFLTYTPDAGSLVLYGVPYGLDKNVVRPGTPRVSLIEAADLSLEWEAELPGLLDGQLWQETGNSPAGAFWQPAVAFAPDRGVLHIVHANEEKLTTVDLAQRTLHTVEISPIPPLSGAHERSWFERLLALTAGVAQAKMVEGTTKQAVLSEDESRLYVVGVAHETGASLGLQVIEAESGAEIARLDTQATEIGIWPSDEDLRQTSAI